MPNTRNWNDVIAERRAKMTPEERAHSDGYQMGFRDAHESWEWAVAFDYLWTLFKERRSLRKRLKKEGNIE